MKKLVPTTATLFVMSSAMLIFSFVLQYHYQLSPCPLCLLQRIALIFITMLLGIALIHRPTIKVMKRYYIGVLIFALSGALLAGWQLWLQHHPTQNTGACLPSVVYMLKHMGFSKTIQLIASDTGRCGEVVWRFLSLSIPGWTLIASLFISLFSGIVLTKQARPSPDIS